MPPGPGSWHRSPAFGFRSLPVSNAWFCWLRMQWSRSIPWLFLLQRSVMADLSFSCSAVSFSLLVNLLVQSVQFCSLERLVLFLLCKCFFYDGLSWLCYSWCMAASRFFQFVILHRRRSRFCLFFFSFLFAVCCFFFHVPLSGCWQSVRAWCVCFSSYRLSASSVPVVARW